MSKKNRKIVAKKIRKALIKIVRQETGSKKFQKKIRKYSIKLASKIDETEQSSIKSVKPKVWKK